MRHLARNGCSYRVIRDLVISHSERRSYAVHQAPRPRATRAFTAASGGQVGIGGTQRHTGGRRWTAAALALAVVAGILAAGPPAQASSPSVTLTSLTADAACQTGAFDVPAAN